MRILITGCGGMLGEAVYSKLEKEHEVFATDIDLNEDWLEFLDVRWKDAIDNTMSRVKPEAVIHLAALTDMEYCELNPVDAYDTNYMGAYNVVRAAAEKGLPLVYVSSAGIFDGKKDLYNEDDKPNPLNVYAKSKFAGELAALSYPNSVVIRAGWMMGGGPRKDKKFINKIIKQIRAGTKELHIVEDKFGTPTYTYDLAETIGSFVENGKRGVYHGACAGGGSRVDVTRALLTELGMNGNIKLQPVNSHYFKEEYFAVRPHSEKLSSCKIEPLSDWRDCLRDYIRRFDWL